MFQKQLHLRDKSKSPVLEQLKLRLHNSLRKKRQTTWLVHLVQLCLKELRGKQLLSIRPLQKALLHTQRVNTKMASPFHTQQRWLNPMQL